MANEATALDERFERLGFRVIEGGKSGRAVLFTTRAVPEMFGVAHRHVLRDVRRYQEKLGPNLGAAFAEHCRPAKYIGRDNTERDCFELTKVGFLTVGPKYDEPLGFLLALGFDALERNDAKQKADVIDQINARIRELRERKLGTREFDFDAEPKQCEQQHEQQTIEHLQELGREPPLDLQPQRPTRDDKVLDELTANERHLRAIADMGHSMAYDPSDESAVARPVFMRDELPIGHSADSWRVWVSEQWFRLPLELRQRWWKDTDYGKRAPTSEMIEAIIAIAMP